MKKQRKVRLIEGLPVIDAKYDLNIEITGNDVKNSKKGDSSNCAAAVACKRKFHKEVRVYLTKTYIKTDKCWIRYLTPERISREIVAFDRGSNFVPGIYKILAPTKTYKLGHKTSRRHTTTGKGNPKTYHVTKEVRSYKEQSK